MSMEGGNSPSPGAEVPPGNSASPDGGQKLSFAAKMVSGLKTVKNKTVEVAAGTFEATRDGAHSLGSKMPTKQGISQMGRRGKHAVITSNFFPGGKNQTKASKDVSYELKHRTAHNSLIILSDLYKEFNLFVKHAAAIADRYQAVADLLEKFRQSCDGYIEMETTEAEGYMEEDDDEADGGKKRGASPPLHDSETGGGAGKMPTVSGDAELADAKTEVIQHSMKKIREVTDEMRFTLSGSCMSLLSNTMKSLESETNRVQADVVTASVDYDLSRDSVNKLQNEVDKLKESLNRAEDHHYALSPQVRASVQEDCDEKEKRLGDLKFEQEEHRDEFQRHMLDGRTDLLFTLEQTSMATWSCFNILFHQMQRFFGDIAAASEPAAQAMITLKNNQTVAKAIDRERKRKLKNARLNSELRAGVAPATAGSNAAPLFGGTVSPKKKAEVHPFDDLFQDFMDSRQESIPEIPVLPASSPTPEVTPPTTVAATPVVAAGHSDPFANMVPYNPPATGGAPAKDKNAGSAGPSNKSKADGLDFFD